MKPPTRKPKIKIITWLLGILLAVGSVLWLAFRTVYEREVALFTAPPTDVLLHSKLRYDEVTVPFTLASGQICVQAKLDGQKVRCSIDTGAPFVLIPQSLNLVDADAVLYLSVKDADAGGNTIEARRALLKSVQIGDYELRGVPVLVAPSAPSARSQANPDYYCLLGDSIFSSAVVTIDYHLRSVTFRNASYNPAKQSHLPMTHSFPFHWAPDKVKVSVEHFGLIIVSGTISGQPATLALDTGWSSDMMGINHTAYQRLFPASPFTKRKVLNTTFGQAKGVYIPDLVCSLKSDDPRHPDLKFHQPALVIADQDDGVDAIWGYAVLRDYRVTIDYPRQRIFLEPYGPAATAK